MKNKKELDMSDLLYEAMRVLEKRNGKMKKRKKPQFSKLHVIFADLLVAFVYISNFFLVTKGLPPVSDIAVTIITIYGGFATGGYFTQNCVRDCSKNKHGIKIDEYNGG